jgi:hypothetical protein
MNCLQSTDISPSIIIALPFTIRGVMGHLKVMMTMILSLEDLRDQIQVKGGHSDKHAKLILLVLVV